jgi:hypothetical protein
MSKRSLSLWIFVMFAAASAIMAASPQVTLTLKNGDRVKTELIDLGGVGFTIKSGGRTETLGENDVAFIDFTGGAIPASEITSMQNGSPFVALRNGDVVMGRLIDIGGVDPLRLTVRTPNGNQDFNSNEVARIFLGKWNGMPTPAAQAGSGSGSGSGRGQGQGQGQGANQGQTQTFAVPASECWVRTGINVVAGERVSFSASGEIQLSGDRRDVAGPAGSRTGRMARVAPMPDTLLGALIGRIDNRRPFSIEDQTQAISMPATGELWIGVNDNPCGDNRGEFTVRISAGRR